jgi:hypothetical protein
LAYKRGSEPPAAGDGSGGTQRTVHSLSYSPTTSSATHQGLGSHAPSPALLVFAPLQAPPVPSNIVPRAHHCWTYGPLGRNQDKSLCHLLLSIDHRGIDLGVIYWLVSGPYSAPTFVISGNTIFIIGGHSNFECKLAENRVEVPDNSKSGPRKSMTLFFPSIRSPKHRPPFVKVEVL